jgi:hypothetical protein
MGLDQIGITLSGVIAVWLTQDKRATRRRWACIFGMLAQPFWFYAAWRAEQWGIFAMCTLYTYAWARGLWTHWLRPVQSTPAPAMEAVASLRPGPAVYLIEYQKHKGAGLADHAGLGQSRH